MNDELLTLDKARQLRAQIHSLDLDIKRMEADKARIVSHLRTYCPHEDTRHVTSLMPATICNTCGLANTGAGWTN